MKFFYRIVLVPLVAASWGAVPALVEEWNGRLIPDEVAFAVPEEAPDVVEAVEAVVTDEAMPEEVDVVVDGFRGSEPPPGVFGEVPGSSSTTTTTSVPTTEADRPATTTTSVRPSTTLRPQTTTTTTTTTPPRPTPTTSPPQTTTTTTVAPGGNTAVISSWVGWTAHCGAAGPDCSASRQVSCAAGMSASSWVAQTVPAGLEAQIDVSLNGGGPTMSSLAGGTVTSTVSGIPADTSVVVRVLCGNAELV